jgi:hypothetical protein
MVEQQVDDGLELAHAVERLPGQAWKDAMAKLVRKTIVISSNTFRAYNLRQSR